MGKISETQAGRHMGFLFSPFTWKKMHNSILKLSPATNLLYMQFPPPDLHMYNRLAAVRKKKFEIKLYYDFIIL